MNTRDSTYSKIKGIVNAATESIFEGFEKKIQCPKSFEIADILLYSLLIFFD